MRVAYYFAFILLARPFLCLLYNETSKALGLHSFMLIMIQTEEHFDDKKACFWSTSKIENNLTVFVNIISLLLRSRNNKTVHLVQRNKN